MRLLLEIIAEIKRVVNDPTFLISVKINCEDSTSNGISAKESIITAQMLEAVAVDLIEISGKTYEQEHYVQPRVSLVSFHVEKRHLMYAGIRLFSLPHGKHTLLILRIDSGHI